MSPGLTVLHFRCRCLLRRRFVPGFVPAQDAVGLRIRAVARRRAGPESLPRRGGLLPFPWRYRPDSTAQRPEDGAETGAATATGAGCQNHREGYPAATSAAPRQIAPVPWRPSHSPPSPDARSWILQSTKADEELPALGLRPASELFRFGFPSRVSGSLPRERNRSISGQRQTGPTWYPSTRTANDRWIASTEMTSVRSPLRETRMPSRPSSAPLRIRTRCPILRKGCEDQGTCPSTRLRTASIC